jgi:hypothetical protein
MLLSTREYCELHYIQKSYFVPFSTKIMPKFAQQNITFKTDLEMNAKA